MGEHGLRHMVYRPAMKSFIASVAVLLWTADAATEPPTQAPQTSIAPAAPSGTTHILPLDDRLEAFNRFRGYYDTAQFDEALPLAQRVVELAEAGPHPDREAPIAYNNLGATQYHLADYAAAAVSYQKSLELLEATQGISSRRLIIPLAGLGTVFAAQDQHALAAAHFSRALAVSRRADGLFNLAQLPLIEQAAMSLHALTDYTGAERERLYALKIVEQNFGYGDPRTLPQLLELARFYEGLREFIAARMMYTRARDVTMQESGGFSPDAIRALIGIARTHRLQYAVNPEAFESQQPAHDAVTGAVAGQTYNDLRLQPPSRERSGLRAGRTALELLRAASDPPPQLLIDTLTELGDWYQTTSRLNLALPFYEEVAGLVAANPERGLIDPLRAPRMVYYRPPLAASRGLSTPTGEYRIRRAVFEFEVSQDGVPDKIAVIESDMSEAQLAQSRRALARAIYCPRFEDGKAVASGGVRFTSEWTEAHEPETADPQAPEKD